MLTAGWVRNSFCAAREKLRSRATVRKTFNSAKSIGGLVGNISNHYKWGKNYKLDMTPAKACTRLDQEMPMDTVRIFDTTLRDGEQSPGFSMNTGEKLRLARLVENLGVGAIEGGF